MRGAVVMNGAGDELLAGSGLALDQDSCTHGCDAGGELFDALYGGASAHQVAEFALGDLAVPGAALVAPLPLLERFLNPHDELVLHKRLLDVVGGAELYHVDSVADVAVAGGHHHDQVGVERLGLAEDFFAALAGQAEVSDQDVVDGFFDLLSRLETVSRRVDFKVEFLQCRREQGVEIGIVLDDQDARLGAIPVLSHRTASTRRFELRRLDPFLQLLCSSRGGAFLSPLRGLFPSGNSTQGLCPGLKSCAPSGLKAARPTHYTPSIKMA